MQISVKGLQRKTEILPKNYEINPQISIKDRKRKGKFLPKDHEKNSDFIKELLKKMQTLPKESSVHIYCMVKQQ